MTSTTKKKVNEPESDSDWDSLPGDVPEPSSSPEPTIKTAATSSLSPSPPKQQNTYGPGKHTGTTTKPVNLYKTMTNSSKKLTTGSNVTTFEDRSGGIWNDGDDEDTKIGSSKESKNYKKNDDSKVPKEKKETRNSQLQASEKKPPFTDFNDALSTPISPSQNRNDHYDQAGVNQAYRIDKEDIHMINHDSWDENENDTTCELPQTHEHKNIDVLAMKHEDTVTRNFVQTSKLNKQDKTDFQPPPLDLALQHSDQFQNCCLIQVPHEPHDDRYRPSFFHGSKNHFHIREDNPRAIVAEIADKSEVVLQRFWREVFGVLQILLNFFTIFILEFFKVMIHSLRYLIAGILYIIGDQFIKPLLSAIFNNLIQPFSILLLNIFTIFSNLLKPLLVLTRELLSQISIPLKAFRLFELNWDHRNKQNRERTDIKVV